MKKIYLVLTAVFAFVSYSQAQITTDPSGNIGIGITSPAAKLDVNGGGNFAGPLQLGGSAVNSNTTKLFIRNSYGQGKNWALSAGANMVTEDGFALYNWTDYPTRPLLFVGNDGSATINNLSGGTLTLQKNSTHVPALIFQGAVSGSNIEAGDDYLTTYVGGSRRLTILSNGNVGIGNTAPAATLDVTGTTTTDGLQVSNGTVFTKMQSGSATVGSSATAQLVYSFTFPVAFASS